MNEKTNKFLLVEDKLVPEMHLRQPRSTYSDSRTFTRNEQRVHVLKETRDSRQIYQNKLDKACFHYDVVYGDFENLARRRASNKVLHD